MPAEHLVVEFLIEHDESGGYNASARVGTHSLITEGDSLDELHAAIVDLLRLFAAQSGVDVGSYRLEFPLQPAAA